MLELIGQIGAEFWALFLEMAPYLMLGFLLAGILHVYFPRQQVVRYLGKRNWRSVVNAALLGIPLPLCSCGVIPTGVSFHKNGASKGAAVSFLISTPQTGVDSILVTYSLLGWPFALIRPFAALITGIVGGQVTHTLDKEETESHTHAEPAANQTATKRFSRMLNYAFVEFLQDIAKWLLIGLVIAAVITVLIPDSWFGTYLSNPYLNMLLVLVASIPMYVCATGSVPIAAALLLKGISPGAAFVFLMAGPATNAGTMTVIGQSMGRKALIAYLVSIIGGALVFGTIINKFLPLSWFTLLEGSASHHHFLPAWLEWSSGIVLMALLIHGIARPYWDSYRLKKIPVPETSNMEWTVKVEGMTCNHCKANVENNLRGLEGIHRVEANIVTHEVRIDGDTISEDQIRETVTGLGYSYEGRLS